jgi:asparagine synthetase B (glutamine-hydrolysing)
MPETAGAVTVSFTNPGVIRREGRHGVWYGSGLSAVELERLAVAGDPAPAGDDAVHRERNAGLVFVELAAGAPARVIAWKGLVGLQELFYARLPDGTWYLTDHFHNAMAVIPQSSRRMSDQALLQHYVGAFVYGRATYARGVDRLANGDRLDIDLSSGEAAVRIFSRHDSTATDEPTTVHLDRLDAAFEDVLGALRPVSDLGVGFSGGVDSTLLMTYLGDAGTPLTLVPGSPEFDSETGYARDAAHLLGRDLVEIRLDEADYLRYLEEEIELLGMPVESYVVPVLSRLYEHDSSLVVLGEGADSIFGSGRGLRRLAAQLSGRAGRGLLRRFEGSAKVGRRAKQVAEYAALFAEPPLSPHGYAGTTLEYHGDMSGTRRIFGEQAMADLNSRLLQEVVDRVELETAENDHFHRHIELSQWRYVFCDLALLPGHAAQARGKKNLQPYLSWRVISEHLKVPARIRYYKGFTGKWLLKELLTRRVKDYQVNKRKLATGLPFERYFERGPLTGIWDHFDIPAVIPDELRTEVRSMATPLTWKAINHAIWEARVVANPGLAPHPAAIAESWPLVGPV